MCFIILLFFFISSCLVRNLSSRSSSNSFLFRTSMLPRRLHLLSPQSTTTTTYIDATRLHLISPPSTATPTEHYSHYVQSATLRINNSTQQSTTLSTAFLACWLEQLFLRLRTSWVRPTRPSLGTIRLSKEDGCVRWMISRSAWTCHQDSKLPKSSCQTAQSARCRL